MPKLLVVIGILIVCAGLDLLWQLRREFRFWDLNIFRAMLGFGIPERALPTEEVARRRQNALQLLLGMALALVLGPALIAIGATVISHVHL
ncbi:MAG: hypothetical protein ACRD8A_16935 [Candidatus Acidiferrales bacterium]